MDQSIDVSSLTNLATVAYQRLVPEPRSRLSSGFGGVLRQVAEVISPSTARSTVLEPGYVDLINRQIESQQQMQLVSLESNVEKSKHETQMAAIRNVRVG